MFIKKASDIPSSEITDERLYLRRREFIQIGAGLLGAAAGGVFAACGSNALDAAPASAPDNATPQTPIANITKKMVTTTEPVNKFEEITGYNNYYEFGTGKSDPSENAGTFRTRPWAVACEGEIKTPKVIDIDQLLKWFPLEERIYRMRCVEAWSMVIPWVGFPLGELIKRLEPTSKAKYVAFTSKLDPAQMPGQKRSVLD
jgi:methionine sulfoxide reductase catalytic subunit